jgi:hypothetical protein
VEEFGPANIKKRIPYSWNAVQNWHRGNSIPRFQVALPRCAGVEAIIDLTGKLCCQRRDLLQEAGIAEEVLRWVSNRCAASKQLKRDIGERASMIG